jgi:uncharacterized protein with NRDE domain
MCLIAVAWQARPDMPLVMAANRDEFHARPTAAAAPWPETPNVFGGRDLSGGGGWLAVNAAARRLAAVTNVRRMVPPDPNAPSRGQLVADFLAAEVGITDYLGQLAPRAERYAGFNLLLWEGETLRFASNHPGFEEQALTAGVHVVSNASLDTPWPKSCRLRDALQAWLEEGSDDTEPLFAALGDRQPAADADLPDTGVGFELEKMLSAPFIVSPGYGTRASTIVVVHASGAIDFTERCFDARGEVIGETRQRV